MSGVATKTAAPVAVAGLALLLERSRAAEADLLACLLTDPEQQIPACLGAGITAGSFLGADHRLLFSEILGLHGSGVRVDAASLIFHLEQTGRIEEAGGRANVIAVGGAQGSALFAGQIARCVRNFERMREVARIAERLSAAAFEAVPDRDPLELFGGEFERLSGVLSATREARAMAFIPVTGVADYGALVVFGKGETHAVRADQASRDSWQYMPGFVTMVLRSSGALSQDGVVAVNRDLFWRDQGGGVRSLSSASADEDGAGNSALSEELARLTRHESADLLSQCSAVFFDNRLLMTASPFIMSEDGNIGFKDLAALDFAPVSSMQGKSAPAWCGEWDGVRFVKLACGSFRGEERCFAVVRNAGGGNELWEILKTGAAETASGDRLPGGAGSAVAALVETPARDFGDAKRRKRLERVEVEVSGVAGPLELRAWWRCDAGGRWNLLDEVATVAPVSDPEGAGAAPHVWRNLSAQGRSQWRTYSVPERVDVIYRRGAQIGFNFQLRISWRGICKIERVRMRAALIDDGDFAERETWAGGARLDLTGNELHYTAGETI